MYSRSARGVVQLLGTTPSHIGPGTYELAAFDGKKANLGSSVSNRAPRFNNKRDEVPGPGAYVVENKENKPIQPEIKISKQRVKFSRKKNAPSIQDPKTAYGFEESGNGELIPQAPPERDPTLGPAYYNTPNTASLTSQYKGVNFSKYSSKRSNFNPKAGPGPGEYDVAEPVQVDVEHLHMKNFMDKKPDLLVPRYPEIMLKTIEKENIPGPGKYDQKRLFEDTQSKMSDFFGIETERPPFGVQAKRFDAHKTVVPGPGAYNESRTAMTSLSKVHGLKKTPFSQSAARFEGDTVFKSHSAPGPGQYRIRGFAEDNLRKAIIDAQRKPAFGQSSIRKFNLTKKDEYGIPGPAQYQIKEKPFKPPKEGPSSNFASGTKVHELQIEETPGPTAYDVQKAFENLVHTKREAPRNKVALKRQESFNVVSRRDFHLSGNAEVPGPGAYDQGLKIKNTIAKLTDRRWKEEREKLPGPGAYELSPMYQDTLLKGTFNATLNNPFVYKDRQKASSDSSLSNRFTINKLNRVPEALEVA